MMDIFANYGAIIKLSFKNHLQYLNYLTKRIVLRQNEKAGILILNFDTKKNELRFEFDEIALEKREEKAKEYLWVGNTSDVTNRYITTDNLERFFEGVNQKEKNSNPIFHLSKKMEKTTLTPLLQKILSQFYPESNREYLDIERIAEFENHMKNIYTFLEKYRLETQKKEKTTIQKEIKEKAKYLTNDLIEQWAQSCHTAKELQEKCVETVKTAITKYLNKEKGANLSFFKNLIFKLIGINLEEIKLITVKIDGQLLIANPEYIEFLYNEKIPEPIISVTKKTKSATRICSLCHTKSDSISAEYLKKAQIKFFNTDKTIFSSNLTKKFDENFALCNSCFENLIIGEKFVLSQFRKKWAGKSLLIIPEITPFQNIDAADLTMIDIASNQLNDLIYSFQQGRDFEKFIEDLMGTTSHRNIVFHYIFFTQSKGGKPNKILKLIKDVPPTRLREILVAIDKIQSEKTIKSPYPIDLKQIYFCIPIRLDSKTKDTKGKEIILEIYDSIFHKYHLYRHVLLEKFVYTLRCLFLETQSLNISMKNPEFKLSTLQTKTLLMNSLISFLEDIGSLEKFPKNARVEQIMSKMKHSELIWNDIKAYWAEKSVYNIEESRALFLYGMMLADVGIAQYKKLKSEAILKRLNFDGMNRIKVIQLVNDIVDKQIKYKIFGYNKEIHAKAQEFFESVDETKWKLSPAENIFFLMSGYAFKKQYLRNKGLEAEKEGEILEFEPSGEISGEDTEDESENQPDEE